MKLIGKTSEWVTYGRQMARQKRVENGWITCRLSAQMAVAMGRSVDTRATTTKEQQQQQKQPEDRLHGITEIVKPFQNEDDVNGPHSGQCLTLDDGGDGYQINSNRMVSESLQ